MAARLSRSGDPPLRVRRPYPFRVATAVESDGRSQLVRPQIKADELALVKRTPDHEAIPLAGVPNIFHWSAQRAIRDQGYDQKQSRDRHADGRDPDQR